MPRLAHPLLFLVILVLAGCAPVLAEELAPLPTRAAAERGRVLFRDKGCIGCHANTRVPGPAGEMQFFGPNLSDYRNEPDFLRRWLADPKSVRPATEMPTLGLKPAEIEDLIAFLNEAR